MENQQATGFTDEQIAEMAAEAEAGYAPNTLTGGTWGPGRLLMYLDTETRAAVIQRAQQDGVPAEAVINSALHQYLESA